MTSVSFRPSPLAPPVAGVFRCVLGVRAKQPRLPLGMTNALDAILGRLCALRSLAVESKVFSIDNSLVALPLRGAVAFFARIFAKNWRNLLQLPMMVLV